MNQVTKLYFTSNDMRYVAKDIDNEIVEMGSYTEQTKNKIIKRIKENSERSVCVFSL
ncbi:hypothetical protein [Vallitalea guaymasensis]|uniref:hypothetical protein n=1 Tax=Vallitalea guaymasensis TaxID=1185412 RepID=UPI00187D2687|nr:hypothetical protein [Vallitalea guaymasensis]